MKNLSISGKLIIGFGSVLALLIITSLISVNSINRINEQTDMYSNYTVPGLRYMFKMQVDMRAASQYILNAIVDKDKSAASEALEKANAWGSDFSVQLEAFTGVQRNNDLDADIERIYSILEGASGARARIVDLLKNKNEENDAEALEIYLDEYEPAVEQVTDILSNFESISKERADMQDSTVDSIMKSTWKLMIGSISISVVLTLILTFVIRQSILTPVKEIVKVYDEMSKGNVQVQVTYESKDELGKMAESIRRTNALHASYIKDVSEKLQLISQGDMRFDMELDYVGDFAQIKKAIENTVYSLNNTLHTINTAAEQVSLGASQVSSGAQALATGATEQAAALEELSVTVTKVAEQATSNSENVKIATQYVEQTVQGVETGNDFMRQLTEAMTDINTASNQIANITKVIDDIAFQTNILALNAAIEAARAGNAGKGFAVVSDEVRILAAKSAEAAKKTAELIQASVDTVSKGTQLTTQTAQILHDISEKTRLVIDNILKVEDASTEQAVAIEQIKQGLNQISAVVQTNAATAEENSATSEEMAAQAATLHEEVGKFKLKNGGKSRYASFVAMGENAEESLTLI